MVLRFLHPIEKLLGLLYNFYMNTKLAYILRKFRIRDKILLAILPFIAISYTVIIMVLFSMLKHSEIIFYDQAEQNIIEKAALIDNTLSNYNSLTEKYIYYSPKVTSYLVTSQKNKSQEELAIMNNFISSSTATIVTDNAPNIMNVYLFNQEGDLYINNAIYSDTVASVTSFKNQIYEQAKSIHGKMIFVTNHNNPNCFTIAKDIFYPSLKRSNEEIGFIMMDIKKSEFLNSLQINKNKDAISVILLDGNKKIMMNCSTLSDEKALSLIQNKLPNNYEAKAITLSYSNCSIVSIINKSVLFHELYKTFAFEIFIVVISIVLLLSSIIGISNSISGQLHDFITKLTKTNKIDSNAYVQVNSQDEFRTLADVYNDMLSRLNHLIETVYLQELLSKNAELKALQAQIDPHFLYNTLDCINCLIDSNELDKAKKTVSALGDLMRMSIKPDQFESVKITMHFLKQYIYIQKMRFQNRVLFLMEIPSSMDMYIIPKLILQPLLENAIIHGVSNTSRQGMIAIIGKEAGEYMIFEIKDNGIGTPKEIRDRLNSNATSNEMNSLHNPLDNASISPSTHIGIFNIQRRLQLIYGKDFDFTITPVSPSGSCVTIRIPKYCAKEIK